MQPTPSLPTPAIATGSSAFPIEVFAMGRFSDLHDHLVFTQQLIDDLGLATAGGSLFAVQSEPFDGFELQRLRSALTDVSGFESRVFVAAPPIERSVQIEGPNPAQPDRAASYRSWITVLVISLVLVVVAFGSRCGSRCRSAISPLSRPPAPAAVSCLRRLIRRYSPHNT